MQRKATWLELFYDLVFVISIASLTSYLRSHISLVGVFNSLSIMVSIWWIWTSFAFAYDLQDSENDFYRIFIFIIMFLIIFFSVSIRHFGINPFYFFLFYTILLGLLVLYKIVLYFFGYGIVFVLQIIFIANNSNNMLIWDILILLSVLTPLVAFHYLAFIKSVTMRVSNFDERLRLFTLIVMGETIALISEGIDKSNFKLFNILYALGTFLIMGSVWYFYFMGESEAITRVSSEKTVTMKTMSSSFLFGYAHAILYCGILLFSVGSINIIDGEFILSIKVMYTMGLFLILFSLAGISMGISNMLNYKIPLVFLSCGILCLATIFIDYTSVFVALNVFIVMGVSIFTTKLKYLINIY